MLVDSAKPEAKATGENVQEVQQKTVLLAVQLTQAILQRIKNSPEQKKDSFLKSKEPATLEIVVDGQVSYRGQEGENPTINNLDLEALQTLKIALESKPGDRVKGNLEIVVNKQPLLEVKEGQVIRNNLSPELSGQLVKKSTLVEPEKMSPMTIDEQTRQLLKQQGIDPSLVENALKPTQTYSPVIIIVNNNSLAQKTAQAAKNLSQKGLEKLGNLKDKVANKVKNSVEQAQVKLDNTRKKVSQKVQQLTPTNPLAKATQSARDNPQPNLLERLGNFKQNLVAQVRSSVAKTRDKIANTVENTKQKVTVQASKVANQVSNNFRQAADRQRDLQAVKVLMTSKQLLSEFGGKLGKNRQFSANNYRFASTDQGVSVTGSRGQVLFNYDAKQGRITDNNLTKQDYQFLAEIKQELNEYQAMKSEPSKVRSTERTKDLVALEAV